MLETVLLGTGGTVPLPQRWLTSLLVRWEGHEILIDCGEGTQIAMHQEGYSCRHIDAIFLTHFHADHTAGLPGLLLSMAKADRSEPIVIYGPKGLNKLLQGVMIIARHVPFAIQYVEYEEETAEFDVFDLHIKAVALQHSVPCYGYALELYRLPKFDPEKAKRNNVPLRCWNTLQKGNTVTWEDGNTYTPDMVLGEPRKGLKAVYATDTRPVPQIVQMAKGADLFIGEGMYGDMEKMANALENKHSMMQETAKLAAQAGVKELWLTHFSPSMPFPQNYQAMVQELFPGAVIAKDGQYKDLNFPEE